MGLKSFLDNIIPNELKGNLGKIALAAGMGYAGFKAGQYAPKASEFLFGAAEQGFTRGAIPGTKGFIPGTSGGFMNTVSSIGSTFDKYKDNPLVKFGKGIVGTTVGKDGQPDTKAENDMYMTQMRALESRYTSNKFSGSPINAGNFQASAVASPGFANSRVQESLGNMAQYMADLQDNGRIDSSALYAEGPKGTTIKVGGSRLSSLKQA